MTPYKEGLINLRNMKQGSYITMGNGKVEEFKLIGDLIGIIKMDDTNKRNRVKISDVSYLPNSKVNLFSLTQSMSKGWLLEGNVDGLKLRKGNQVLTFDIKIPTPKGIISGIQIKRDGEMVCSSSDGELKVDIQEAHSKLGHISIAATRKNKVYVLKGMTCWLCVEHPICLRTKGSWLQSQRN
jgi:hypothetical protein